MPVQRTYTVTVNIMKSDGTYTGSRMATKNRTNVMNNIGLSISLTSDSTSAVPSSHTVKIIDSELSAKASLDNLKEYTYSGTSNA